VPPRYSELSRRGSLPYADLGTRAHLRDVEAAMGDNRDALTAQGGGVGAAPVMLVADTKRVSRTVRPVTPAGARLLASA